MPPSARQYSLGVPGSDLQFVRVLWFYGRDDATEAEKREAYELAKHAVTSSQDEAAGVHLLGLLTCAGFGVAADPAEAVRLQEKAAGLGNADALFELFVRHQTGLGVAPDERTAFEFLQRAAEAGHSRAMYNMGAMSATGRGLPRDPAVAVNWYTRASDAGNHRATAALAVMYATGDGVSKDLEQAGRLFDLVEYMGVDVAALREAVGPCPPRRTRRTP